MLFPVISGKQISDNVIAAVTLETGIVNPFPRLGLVAYRIRHRCVAITWVVPKKTL
jgi:hypothetical protein